MSERYDPFGRPIEGDHPWAQPASDAPLPGGYLPPAPATPAPSAAPVAPEAPERPAAAPATWADLETLSPISPRVAAAGGPPDEALAGWWMRVVAYVIDTIVASALAFAAGVVFLAAGGAEDPAGGIIVIGAAVLAVVYPTITLALFNGRTLGKKICGLRVVRESGEPMTWRSAAMREIVMRLVVISIIGSITFGIAAILDVLWPLWDKRNQALHDHGAETFVVRTR